MESQEGDYRIVRTSQGGGGGGPSQNSSSTRMGVITSKQQSSLSLNKERKRQAIRDLLKQKLGISNIHDIEIGKKLQFQAAAGVSSPSKVGATIRKQRSHHSKCEDFEGSQDEKRQQRPHGGDNNDHLEEILEDNDSDCEFGSPVVASRFTTAKKRQQQISNGKDNKTNNNQAPLRFRDMYTFMGILGHGSYGVVLLVLDIQLKEQRALKIVYKVRLSEDEQEILKQESEILQRLSANHTKSNVVQSYQV